MAELHGEKIDIVDFSADPAEFVANALSPARVTRVDIVDPVAMEARVVVPDYQLSLAIGKEGQNARLAARLTGQLRLIGGLQPALADDAGGVIGRTELGQLLGTDRADRSHQVGSEAGRDR